VDLYCDSFHRVQIQLKFVINWPRYYTTEHKIVFLNLKFASPYIRKLHNEELNDLYSLPNIVRVVKSRRMRWAGHVARMGEDRGVHRVLVGKPEGKRPLGRPRLRWENNIKMDLQKVGGGGGGWMGLAQDRDGWRALVGTVRNFRVP
jgi:hypothetical protein